MRWFEVMPNSASSGSMKVLNMSSTRPFECSLTIARISGLTRVTKTIGFLAFVLGGVVDLAHHLMRLVGGVDERPADVARLDRELRQDRVAEGLGGDAGAVGDEEHRVARAGRGVGRGRCGRGRTASLIRRS